jgi:hypothetical protein
VPVNAIIRLYDTSDPPEEVGVRLEGVGEGGFFEVLYADIPGNSWNQNRLNKFVVRAQELIDQRILRTDLPADDQARLADPARADWFWDGNDVVHRPIIISEARFNGTLDFTLRKVRP